MAPPIISAFFHTETESYNCWSLDAI